MVGAPGLPRPVARPAVRAIAVGAVAIELVLDKLPSTPSRLDRRGLTFRLVLAAFSGMVLARGARRPPLPAMLMAWSSAILGAQLGHDVRVGAARRFPSAAAALVEDGLALGLAVLAIRSGSLPGRTAEARDDDV